MNVRQLIEELGKMPPSAEVLHLWDGVARTNIEHVWLARTGIVVTADFDEECYSEKELKHERARPTDSDSGGVPRNLYDLQRKRAVLSIQRQILVIH